MYIIYNLLCFCLQEVHYSTPLPACGGTPPINKGRGVTTHIATILYGAKLHNYLECKVIRMDFFELLTHRFFLTEVLKDIFFWHTECTEYTEFNLLAKRAKDLRAQRGTQIFLGGHTENTDLHRILTEVHKDKFFSR